MGSFAEEAMIKQEWCWQIKRTSCAKIQRHYTTWCERSHSGEIILEGRKAE